MKSIAKNKNLIILSAILVIFFGIFIFISRENQFKPATSYDNFVKDKTTGFITLEINDQKYEIKIDKEINIYDFMKKLKDEGKIDFKEKKYAGMGEFIEEINGIKNNGEKNWIYYVNNKKANIGVSNYKINIGDNVSWKYEKSY